MLLWKKGTFVYLVSIRRTGRGLSDQESAPPSSYVSEGDSFFSCSRHMSNNKNSKNKTGNRQQGKQ